MATAVAGSVPYRAMLAHPTLLWPTNSNYLPCGTYPAYRFGMPRCTTRCYQAVLAMVCVVVALAYAKGYATMATTTTALVTNRTQGKAAAVATTTPAAQAPAVHAAPLAPSTATLANWRIAGQPSTAKQATNGVGPAPKGGTVGYAALQAIAAAGKPGCSLATMQAAVTAVGLRGKHPVLPLLHWLAKHRGYTFVCTNGMVTLGS